MADRRAMGCIVAGMLAVAAGCQTQSNGLGGEQGASAPLSAAWLKIQPIKKELLGTAAQHAMEQQKRNAADPVGIAFPADTRVGGDIKLVSRADRALQLKGTISPKRWEGGQPDLVHIDLPNSGGVDMVSNHSGLAMTIHSADVSPEVRIGARLYGANGGMVEILPAVVLAGAWGQPTHEVYLDWAFGNYADKDTGKAVETLKSVKAIELTFGGVVRAPERGASKTNQAADFSISDLRVVDYLQGSYDPSRNDWAGFGKGVKDLTLQHRTQEVTGIVIKYGGDVGVRSGIESLDFCARTQCWDGSFLDGRRGAATVTSGEYTFGFWIYGTIEGYMALRDMKNPALREKITIGPETMTRDAFYQRMYYRAAMARAVTIPSKYRDDIIGGDTLMTGANRVLGYAVGMRMVADVLDDPKLKADVLKHYQPIMQEIADAQGRYSGGFQILGEGDIYNGKGIHYDGGYTRTHMDVLVTGVYQTGDPLLVQMLRKYQSVFEATMNSTGTGILPLLSERHTSGDADLIIPDLTAQVGLKYHLPIIEQWGYNDGIPTWAKYVPGKPLNHFTYIARIRGYPLGAHSQFLAADTQLRPEPKDLGYVFPRQYPIWSTRFMNKNAPDKVVHTSKVYVYPDGKMTNDYKIEVGEFPATVGVPVSVKTEGGMVTCEAVEFTGWPKLLPADAPVELGGDVSAKGRIGEAIMLTLEKPTTITLAAPEVKLPKEAGGGTVPTRGTFILTPEKPGQKVYVTILNGTVPYEQKTVVSGTTAQ